MIQDSISRLSALHLRFEEEKKKKKKNFMRHMSVEEGLVGEGGLAEEGGLAGEVGLAG